jgi:phosphatidylserine decarboxylase
VQQAAARSLSSGDLVPSPAYLTLEEVVARYRGQISEGTLRTWRTMRIGPSFIKIGKAVLYSVSELDRWDKFNLVICRPSRSLSLEEYASAR